MTRLKLLTGATGALVFLTLGLGCTKSSAPAGPGESASTATTAASAPAATPIDPATAATITGKVTFDGPAPKMKEIHMDADPSCAAMHKTPAYSETLVVKNGMLADTFVYVKDGLEGRTFAAPTTPVTLTQEGCRYVPHVFGIMVDQPLKIVNDDPVLHNVHAMTDSSLNPPFNVSQPNTADNKVEPTIKKFHSAEVFVKFRCDVHNWMNAYAGVVSNPFYAVTGDDGTFTLKGLPPGTYTIAAVHEPYGASQDYVEQDMKVTVKPKETKTVDFTFKPE